MHRFPADLRLRKVWIQRCKNARPNFVFTNSDQTRLCGQHFVGKCGPSKSNPLPCYFPRADGTEKVYKISTLDSTPLNFEALKNGNQTVEETTISDTEFDNHENGFVFDMNDSMLDISLRLHDYGCPVPPPSRIRHQSEQTQPEMISVSTQTDESRISKTISTQTHILETTSKGCQVQKPALTYEDIAESDSKVLFYTGIPNSG